MKPCLVKPVSGMGGRITLPGDKSIAHRAVILSALSSGKTTIDNIPFNNDLSATVAVFRSLGVDIKYPSGKGKGVSVTVKGAGARGLQKPVRRLNAGESGTTMRLLAGLLCAQDFSSRLAAGRQLSSRPMSRVTIPLRLMGAVISGRKDPDGEEYPPLCVRPGHLHGITYRMPVASAQVKSALLLAGLYCRETTKIIEPVMTRDHSERMLKIFGADISTVKRPGRYEVRLRGGRFPTSPGRFAVPGDISSSAFFLTLAVLCPGGRIIAEKVSLNPSRNGVLGVLKRMGARISVRTSRDGFSRYEPYGDIEARHSILRGTVVRAEEIPSLIDELPILMVAAATAKGVTVFRKVGELRYKETDRIHSMCTNLRLMGGRCEVRERSGRIDIAVEGVKCLSGRKLRSYGDHRTAMSLYAAACCARGESLIDDISCADKSLPGFPEYMRSVSFA